jgi:hypothetical protein
MNDTDLIMDIDGYFAMPNNVFVSTSFPAVSLGSSQDVVLASQPVGLSMRQLWSFDIFAEGTISPSNVYNGQIDVWICDKTDCTGSIKVNLANASLSFNSGNYFHLKGTFAQTNHGHPTAAVLTGELGYLLTPSGSDYITNEHLQDIATPPTPPIDLYTGNRFAVLTTRGSGGGTMTITVFRVNLLP